MDWQVFFNVGTILAVSVVSGYVRFVQSQLGKAREIADAAETTMTAFRIEVAKDYVTHTDLRRIEDALVRIEAKIDVKADK